MAIENIMRKVLTDSVSMAIIFLHRYFLFPSRSYNRDPKDSLRLPDIWAVTNSFHQEPAHILEERQKVDTALLRIYPAFVEEIFTG